MKHYKIRNAPLDFLFTSLVAILMFSALNAGAAHGDSGAESNLGSLPSEPLPVQNRPRTSGWAGVIAYPEIPSSEVDRLACYMKTADGRTLDLQQICIEGLTKRQLDELGLTQEQ